MLEVIKNKILDIESKVSSPDIIEISNVAKYSDLKAPVYKRYSNLKSNANAELPYFITEMNLTLRYFNDATILSNQFYNTKESQMQALRDRYEVLSLRKRVLNSFAGEDNITVLPLNDKNMFVSDKLFGIDESGVWFPTLETSRVIPTNVTILSDSNVKLGAESNPIQNSKIEALWTDDQNDLFSFHREDDVTLKLCMSFKFGMSDIVNEMEFEYIKSAGQDVNLFVRNTQNQDVLYNGPVKDYWVQFAKPAKTDSLYVEIKVSPKRVNQFDIKKIGFLKVKYKNELKAKSIRMPIFSNRYLFFKDYTLLDDRQKEFLSFKIQANAEDLQYKDIKLSGPYKDPELYIECSISNMKSALNYLEKPKFQKSKTLPALLEKDSVDLKLVEELFTSQKKTIIHVVENSNRVFLSLPVANLDDYFKVTVNGEKQTRSPAKDLANGYYFSEYTGEGYAFYFSSLSVGTPVDLYLSTIPTYVYGQDISIPHNGLGSTIGLEYAKELKIARMSPIYSGNKIILDKKYIQKIIFKELDGREVPWRLVNKNEAYLPYEYFLDRVEGIVYLNEREANIGSLDVYYLETEQIAGKTETENKSINCPENILTFNYVGTLGSLLDLNFRIFSLMDKVLDLPSMSLDLRTIQLPKSISLHYGSVRISNKKEVPYVDGQQELSTLSDNIEYFDFKSKTEDGIITYRARNTNLNLDEFFAKTLSIDDYAFDRRAPYNTPVNEGDYAYNNNELYLKSNQNHSLTVGVRTTTSENLNVFSVDYSTNRIYVKMFNTLNWYDTGENIAAQQTPISFDYSCIRAVDFTLEKEIPKKEILNANEYFCYISNTKLARSLLSYYSPVIESIALGVIG